MNKWKVCSGHLNTCKRDSTLKMQRKWPESLWHRHEGPGRATIASQSVHRAKKTTITDLDAVGFYKSVHFWLHAYCAFFKHRNVLKNRPAWWTPAKLQGCKYVNYLSMFLLFALRRATMPALASASKENGSIPYAERKHQICIAICNLIDNFNRYAFFNIFWSAEYI